MEEIKNCKKCGTECNAAFKFCPNCGADLEDNKCKNCGTELIEGAKFCVNCGTNVAELPVSDDSELTREEADFESEAEDNVIEEATATYIRAEKSNVAKPKKVASEKKKFIVRLIKNASMLVLCVILFGLSFANIITVKMDTFMPESEIKGVEVSFSAIDIISFMGSTAEGDGAYEKYREEYIELENELEAALEADYNDRLGKIVLSAKTKSILSDYVNSAMKFMLANESAKGGPEYNNIIIAGVFCLVNILFASAMLIVSVISFVFVALRKKNRVSKYLYAMPVYLFISLLILFMVKTSVGFIGSVAGAMVASLFFESIALILTVLLVVSASKGKPIKNAIPKFVSLAMSIVICACLFAPVLTAKYDVVLQGKVNSKVYTVSVNAGSLVTYLSPENVEEYENSLSELVYDYFMDLVEMSIDSTSEMNIYEFNSSGGIFTTEFILSNLTIAIGEYSLIGALSMGYYVLLLVFMLFAAFAVWTIATLYKKGNGANSLLAVILVLVIIALACSIGWICVLNYHLEGYDMSFTVGGSLIAATVLIIINMIASGIITSAFTPKKRLTLSGDLDTMESEAIA